MLKTVGGISALLMLVACSHSPQTDAQLQSEAQQAVNKKLDAQGVFSLMEAVAKQKIACGHVQADTPSRGHVEQDFVYQSGRVILDDDPDFDQAAIECDVAASGGNSSAADANTED